LIEEDEKKVHEENIYKKKNTIVIILYNQQNTSLPEVPEYSSNYPYRDEDKLSIHYANKFSLIESKPQINEVSSYVDKNFIKKDFPNPERPSEFNSIPFHKHRNTSKK
jgi:hypothetical protein